MRLEYIMAFSVVLFGIGVYGAISQKNAIRILMCIELMLNAVNINLVGFSRLGPFSDVKGQLFSLFVMAIACAEAAVGFAIILQLARHKGSIDIDKANVMRG